MPTSSRPPFDPELAATLALMGSTPRVTPELIPQLRSTPLPLDLTDAPLEAAGLVRREVTVPGAGGAELPGSVIARADHAGSGPGIFHIHGGGMIAGQRMVGVSQIVSWLAEHDAVALTVDYRLAPEHPDPTPVEDCYAALNWMVSQAGPLGFDPDRLLVAGASAGGGLAAGVALLARDRGGPSLCGQMLICPMLDDRDQTVSTRQYDDAGTWVRESNRTGWSALLGERRCSDDVSPYAAPARARDLTGLPPAYVECGSAELFRDEDVAYASALWAAGVQAELHAWAGGFHGFDLVAPHAALSHQAIATRRAWLARMWSDSKA